MDKPTPPYYDKHLPDGTLLDVYTICQLYGVCQLYGDTAPPVFHAIKKLLRAGKGRGGKSLRQDVAEARDALNRFLEMTVEAEPATPKQKSEVVWKHPNREEVERGIEAGRAWQCKLIGPGEWKDQPIGKLPAWDRDFVYRLAPIEP